MPCAAHCARQAADVSLVLQNKRLAGCTVKLKLRWPDFTTLTRQVTLAQPTDEAGTIFTAAAQLFERVWQGQPVRLIGVGVSGFQATVQQMSLWDEPDERNERLYSTVQSLRQRFGSQVVRRASDLDAD